MPPVARILGRTLLLIATGSLAFLTPSPSAVFTRRFGPIETGAVIGSKQKIIEELENRMARNLQRKNMRNVNAMIAKCFKDESADINEAIDAFEVKPQLATLTPVAKIKWN